MSQSDIIRYKLMFGFSSGRPLGGLNLPVGQLACTEASGLIVVEGLTQ
jgi:hypothetical protein